MRENLSILQDIGILDELNNHQQNLLLSTLKIKSYQKGEVIIHENALDEDIYIVKEGTIRVEKTDDKTKITHTIAMLGPGSLVGELSALDRSPRSAQVVANTNTDLLVLSLPQLKNLSDSPKKPFFSFLIKSKQTNEIYNKVMKNIGRNVAQHLRQSNVNLLNELKKELELTKKQVAISYVILGTFVIFAIYFLFIGLFFNLNLSLVASTILGAPALFVFTLITLFVIHKSGFPFRFFGFNLNHWKYNILEAFIFTLPFLLLTLLYKYIYLLWHPSHPHLFNLSLSRGESLSTFASLNLAIVYLLFIPCQEIIFRGTLQTALAHFLAKPFNQIRSILLSSMMFATTHVHLGLRLVMITALLGMFWGFLFARQKSLVGVIFSHGLVAIWGLYIVGLF